MDLQDLSVGLLQVPNKQWGFEETETKTIAFPISFESIKYVFLSKIYGPASGGADTVAYNFFRKSLTGVSFDYAYTRNWLAIGGKQPQWGYYVESQNPTDYRYWSIPFTSHYITMATKTYYEPKEEAVPWLVGIDMQKFICGYGANFIGSSYVSCVGIGCQPQWGKTISGNNVKTKFPIAFTAFCMLSVSVNSSNGNAAESVFRNGFGYTNKTLSDWILRGPTGDATYFADYIAIGCQPQWRNNPGLWAIPFTEFVAGGITMTRTGSQSSGTWYGDSGTISLTGYTASCATNESWVSNISGSAIAVGL